MHPKAVFIADTPLHTVASPRPKRRCSGFTMPEGLFGMAIMGILFVTLYTGMTMGFNTIRSSRENLRATQILLEKFETIRLYNWEQVNTPGYIPADFVAYFDPRWSTSFGTNLTPGTGVIYTGTVSVVSAPVTEAYSNDLRMITVQLSWASNGRLCRRSLSSYIARYGLQNYVY